MTKDKLPFTPFSRYTEYSGVGPLGGSKVMVYLAASVVALLVFCVVADAIEWLFTPREEEKPYEGEIGNRTW